MAVSGGGPENRDLTFSAGMATALLCMLFGANAVAVKISLSGLGVFTVAGLRFGAAAVVICIWARATGRPLGVSREKLGPLGVISLVFTVQLSLFYLGINRSNASRATLIVNLQPFIVLFLAHFFIPGDRMSLRKTIGMLMGFSGVAFVFMEPGGGGDIRTGDLIVLSATLIWGFNAVYVKRVIHRFRPYQVVVYPMAFSVPVFFVQALLFDGVMVRDLSTPVLLAVAYQTLVTASFGFVAWNTLLKQYGAVSVHSFIFIMPVSGVLLGGVLLDEPITGKIVLALVLIVGGILTAHMGQRRPVPLMPLGKNI